MRRFGWVLVLLLTMGWLAPGAGAGETVLPGDVLRVHVWRHPDLSGDYPVDAKGTVSLPMIGAVSVRGLTCPRVSESVRKRLADGHIKDPHVRVSLLSRHTPQVPVLGAVHKPGPVPARRRLTLAMILAKAGGLTERASGEAVILSGSGKERKATRIDLHPLLRGDKTAPVVVRPGDTVVFPVAVSAPVTRVFSFGEARRVGALNVRRGASLAEAVAAAGGLTDASDGTVQLFPARAGLRRGGTHSVEDVLAGESGRGLTVNEGDLLFFGKTPKGKVYVLGQVNRPGTYDWAPGMTVFDAVMTAGGFTKDANTKNINIDRRSGTKRVRVRGSGNTPLRPGDVLFVHKRLL